VERFIRRRAAAGGGMGVSMGVKREGDGMGKRKGAHLRR